MSDDLPLPIQEAKLALAEQGSWLKRMLGGVFGFMTVLLTAAILDAPDPIILGSVVGILGWTLGNIGLMMGRAPGWQRAHKVIEEWDRRALTDELEVFSRSSTEVEPEDPRWASVKKLVDRIRELADGDTHTVAVAEEVLTKLRGMTADLDTLRDAIEADAALGGDSDQALARTARLQGALDRRQATADRLVEAIRDLHVELAVRDASSDPIVDRLEALLAQVEAESEVAAVGSVPLPVPAADASSEAERKERARQAAQKNSARSRE